MGTPNYPKDLASEWNQVKRDVKNAFTSANLRTGMAKIGARVIEITGELVMNAGAKLIAKYANGNDAFSIKELSYNGNPVGQVSIKRFDGSTVFQVFGGEGEPGFFSMHDRPGNIIFSDDAGSGSGLARPWLPYQTVRLSDMISPTLTTGTGFSVHHVVHGWQQHPKMLMNVYIQTSGTDVAQWRIRNPSTGNVLATSSNITNADYTSLEINHENYNFGSYFKYDIEIRRVSGTGSGVGICPVISSGKQS